jgi:hypothetical protein
MQQRVVLNEAVVVAGALLLMAIGEPETPAFIAVLAVTTVLYAVLGWYLHPGATNRLSRLVLWLAPPIILALAGLVAHTYIAIGPVFLYFSLGHLRTTYSAGAGVRPTFRRLFVAVTPALLMLLGLGLLWRFLGVVIRQAILWLVSRS